MKNEKTLDTLKEQIDKWGAEIDVMKAGLKHVNAELRADYRKSLLELEKRRARASEQYEELKEASEDSFDQIRQGVITAWQELASSVRSAKDAFRGMM